MIEFGQHTIPKPCLRIIGIAGFIRLTMMHMMRDHINLFRYGLYHEVLGNKTPHRMAEAIGFVRTISMKPNGAVRAHDPHAIDDDGDYEKPGKRLEEEEKKEGKKPCEHQETDE